jgi:hypothetical protein
MSHDEIQELLGAYALDAVDADEAAEVEAHLPTCARCRAEVEEHREVAGLLAHTGTDAPDGLWDRISDSLSSAGPPLRLAPVPPAEEPDAVVVPLRRRSRALTWAGGAVAAALVAVLGVQVVEQGQRIDDMEQAAAQDPAERAFELARADAGSRTVELTGDDGTVVTAVLTEDGDGWLDATSLESLDPSQTYQLWGAAGDVLVSLGVLGPSPRYVHFDGRGYEALAVTAEDSPGVVVSDEPAIVAGAVTA